jgi:hypothetical protein
VAPSFARVSTIFAWPGATDETIGCAGCDAQPATEIAMNENIARIPNRIARERYGSSARETNEFF